jgi:hypothetical protein
MTMQHDYTEPSGNSLEQLLRDLEAMRPLKYEPRTNTFFASLQEKAMTFWHLGESFHQALEERFPHLGIACITYKE